MTYYDRLSAFFDANSYAPLPATAQLLYLHLLQLDNQHGNTGAVRCPDSRFVEMLRLNKKTIAAARRTLIDEGFIRYETLPGKPRYGSIYHLLELEMARKPKLPVKKAPMSENSSAIKAAWEKWCGARNVGYELIALENQYGTERLLTAIQNAGIANSYPTLSLRYLKYFLPGGSSDGNAVGSVEEYAGDDELPAEYRGYQG